MGVVMEPFNNKVIDLVLIYIVLKSFDLLKILGRCKTYGAYVGT